MLQKPLIGNMSISGIHLVFHYAGKRPLEIVTIYKFEIADLQYIAGTLSQTWVPGQFLLKAPTLPSTAEVALQVTGITGRTATATLAGLLRNIGYAGSLPYSL